MEMKGKRLLVVSVCLGLLLVGSLLAACWRENVSLTAQGITNLDSLTLSRDLVVGGNVSDKGATFRVNDNVLITGTLAVQGNVSDQGDLFRINDNTSVTGTLGVSSQVNAGNGVAVTGNITATGDATVVGLTVSGNVSDSGDTFRINDAAIITGGLGILGNLYDTGGDVRIADNVLITGTLQASGDIRFDGQLAVQGNLYDQGDLLRLNDNTSITGTLGVSSQVTADGLYSTNAITSTAAVSVGTWMRWASSALYSIVAATHDGAVITPTATFMMLSADGVVGMGLAGADTQGAGTLLILYNHGAQTITISDTVGCNLTGNVGLTSDDAMFLVSDGTVWVEVGVSAN